MSELEQMLNDCVTCGWQPAIFYRSPFTPDRKPWSASTGECLYRFFGETPIEALGYAMAAQAATDDPSSPTPDIPDWASEQKAMDKP